MTPRRARLLTALILLGIFAAGAFTGAALCRWGQGRPPGPRLPPPWRTLGLDPEQTEKASAIALRHRPDVEAVLREAFPRIHEIQRAMDAELVPILTPEQRARLEELQRQPPPRVPLE